MPSVIFEMTSEGTQDHDKTFKKTLYEQLGVREYWLFDPRGEWVEGQLEGYRLEHGLYRPITDGRSAPLNLQLKVEGQLIGFYREDSGEKLLIPQELNQALKREALARQQAEQQAERERQRAEEERQRAEEERQRADQAEARLAELQARLKDQGIDSGVSRALKLLIKAGWAVLIFTGLSVPTLELLKACGDLPGTISIIFSYAVI